MTKEQDAFDKAQQALDADRKRREALERDLKREEQEVAPPSFTPDHARDGGVI